MTALMNMQTNFNLTPFVLQDLRSVATPEAAKQLLPVMTKAKVTRKEFEAQVAVVVHEMLVDWHWAPENTFIHPAKRVCPSLWLVCNGLLVFWL